MNDDGLQILLMEDDPGDAELIRYGFERRGPGCALRVAHDGEEGLRILRESKATAIELPDLILLDLNMPRMDGHQVLRNLKEDTRLHDIPVLVLSTSSTARDVSRAYGACANAYLVKPDSLDRYLRLADVVLEFWGGWAHLPPVQGAGGQDGRSQ